MEDKKIYTIKIWMEDMRWIFLVLKVMLNF